MTGPDVNELGRELCALWSELLALGATVRQVPFESSPEVLRARVAHERRRLRALSERGVA